MDCFVASAPRNDEWRHDSAVFGEIFGPIRYAGMALILAGLAVIMLPARWVTMATELARR
jgi:hypothetical protein